MKRLILALIIMGLVFGSAYAYNKFLGTPEKSEEQTSIDEQNRDSLTPKINPSQITDDRIGKPAAEITLNDLRGKKVSLSDYKGKKVLVNFWASWCRPCKEEMPIIEKLHKESKDKDYLVLTVDIGESKKTVSEFQRNKGYTFNVLMDEEQEVAEKYLIQSIPTSFFIDKNGILRSVKVGVLQNEDISTFLNLK